MRSPLILAPLAGGPCTPELVAAVCNNGGIGSVGAAYLNAAALENFVEKLRAMTHHDFIVNLFIPQPDPALTPECLARAQAATAPFREAQKLATPLLKPPFAEDFAAQFKMMLQLKPAAFSFVFGRLAPEYRKVCQEHKIQVIGTASSLDEALMLDADNVDAIILQGLEAGGHRAIFDDRQKDPDVPLLELIRQCRGKIRRRLIAAGGLMSGADAAEAMNAGADAVQLGTAYLLCPEAGTSIPYRNALQSGRATRLTRAFSGRIARGLINRFMEEMDAQPDNILPFPAQNAFTRDLRRAGMEQNNPELLSLWAGTGYERMRLMPAGELTRTLLREISALRAGIG